MKTLALVLITLFAANAAQALEGVKIACNETRKSGQLKGVYPLPVIFMQEGDSLSLSSYVHISERYLLTVVPPLSDAIQGGSKDKEVRQVKNYEVLLTRLPSHEKLPTSTEKVCHAASVFISGTDAKSLEIKYHKKDDVGGFLSFSTRVHCDLTIINI